VPDESLELVIPPGAFVEAMAALQRGGADLSAPYIVFAPGASAAARRYDLKRSAEVARILSEDMGYQVVIMGSAREAQLLEPVTALAKGGNPRLVSLVGATSIPEMAAVIRGSAMVIANNSSSLHIADAFGRPCLVLYSGTEYESQWRPRRSAHRLMRIETDCSPCFLFQCPYQMECLDISPKEVARAAAELVSQPAQAAIIRSFQAAAAISTGSEDPSL
jgi:ADP-heptose:LPS heptosyltransferase